MDNYTFTCLEINKCKRVKLQFCCWWRFPHAEFEVRCYKGHRGMQHACRAESDSQSGEPVWVAMASIVFLRERTRWNEGSKSSFSPSMWESSTSPLLCEQPDGAQRSAPRGPDLFSSLEIEVHSSVRLSPYLSVSWKQGSFRELP